MGLINKIIGKKTLEIVRNLDGTFEVSSTGGQEIEENLVDKYKEILSNIDEKIPSYSKRTLKIKYK